jgi:hypothetical protein
VHIAGVTLFIHGCSHMQALRFGGTPLVRWISSVGVIIGIKCGKSGPLACPWQGSHQSRSVKLKGMLLIMLMSAMFEPSNYNK